MIDIGIIAEDQSDIDVLLNLTSRTKRKYTLFKKKFIGHGGGALKNKCRPWVKDLFRRGCSHVVILHDLDSYKEERLRSELNSYLDDADAMQCLVLIPVREIESWLLSDPLALEKTFNMKRKWRVPSNPESLLDPKKELRNLVFKMSGRYYSNAIDNSLIAEKVQVSLLMRKCRSFRPYPSFIKKILN